MAGRLAPFIELGVGFNPELTSRENVALNGVMMGAGPPRGGAPARLGARLRRAARVRRPQAQELLVGHDGPARLRGHGRGRRRHHARSTRCSPSATPPSRRSAWTSSAQKRARGQHARARDPRHGDRPGLLRPRDADPRRRAALHRRPRGGRAALLPAELRRRPEQRDGGPAACPDVNVRIVDAWLEDEAGERVENVEQGEPIGLTSSSRRATTSRTPVFGFHFLNADGEHGLRLQPDADGARRRARPRRRGRARADRGDDREPAAARRYFGQLLDLAQPRRRAISPCTWCGCSTSSSTGRGPGPGSVSVEADVDAALEPSRDRHDGRARAARRAWPLGARRRLAARAGPALPDRRHGVQAHLLRHRARLPVVARAAADALRRAAGGLHAGVPLGDRCPTTRSCCCSTSCSSASSRRRRGTAVGSIVSQEAVVRKTQFPRLVIPLAVVLTSSLQPGAEPRRGLRLHPRLRGDADVDLAAVPGPAGDARRDHRRGLDDRLVALPALPRHGDHLDVLSTGCSTGRRSSIRSKPSPTRCATSSC